MSPDWEEISHVTKVDPAESLPEDLSVLEGTDLVIVGGSDGVTRQNSLNALERIRAHHPDVPLFQEPYSSSHVSEETIGAADFLSVPAVYNGDRENFVAKHVDFFTEVGSKPEEILGSGLPLVGDLIASRGRDAIQSISEKILAEGYVVQNLDSKAAAVSGVETTFTTEQVAGAALATESFYGFPIFYVEYSGTYGGPEDVAAAATYLDDTVLLYGGGIESREQTEEILDAGADAVVVGDCFHEDPERYRRTIP
ncbi:heptaprenylglyceryl phosphate synthase [Halopelagius longus]|uniref:Geranylgeranylglyceryl phosphate synthase n=1 Tax=Halopelagius longus TaxID=1236180 RepID=A0A1H1AUY1_9EURY|nr:heptaprenylglyceryl phosphate synthase [Halopelagius longus]RDI70522.1 heptaprenylglyceryl phosphate synthase [Halopelagius longus]SDQ43341.1 geranylgeranylglyceryl diphosphate synthase [Halopelagius longus]